MADKRTVWQQARSGFRLAGFVLLTFALCLLFLFSTILLTGRGQNRTPVHELLGGCGLLAIATVMFFSVRYWAKWYFAMLVYISFKLSLSLLLGRTPSVPSIVRPRLEFLEYFIVIVAMAVLCFRYVDQVLRRIETLGLIALVISFGFSTGRQPLPALSNSLTTAPWSTEA